MTSPVTTDDIVQGCVKWLEGFAEVRAVLGVYPDTATPWLFQHKLWSVIEGSQSTAAVVSHAGGWAGANPHNTLRFPRLSLELFADPIRDAGNNITDPGEAYRRINVAYETFDTLLHRPASGTQMWGDVRTIASQRIAEPAISAASNGDGLLRLQVFYGVTVG